MRNRQDNIALPNGGEKRNNSQEVIKTVAVCSARSGVSVLAAAFDPKTIALARDKETEHLDARFQDGPRPSNFGEFPPIPLDAIAAVVTIAEESVDSVEVDEEEEK